MRRHSLLPLLWLVCLDNVHTVHSQQHSDQEHRRRPPEQQKEFTTEDEFIEDIRSQGIATISQIHRPKHVVEAVRNSLVVSGGLFLSGAATMVGIPGTFLWAAEKPMGYIAGLIGGSILGVIFGASQWGLGAIYSVVQMVMGIYATPTTVWAWMRGRNVYDKDNKWQYYNLTEESERLADVSVYGDGNVRDDSLYRVLGVETTAAPKDIKKAYYRLAKDHHPDKNPDSTELFLKIHDAYETLYDQDRRKAYDELGSSAFSNANSFMATFDPGVFVDVFFGVSPELEHYVGDLTIKSFSKSFLKIAMVAQAAQEEEGAGRDPSSSHKIAKDMLLLAMGSHLTDVRQVDVALHLQQFTHDFVVGDMTEGKYRVKCLQEALAVLKSTPFAEKMLRTIGTSLYWDGGHRTVSNPLDLPLTLVRKGRGVGRGMRKWKDVGGDLYRLFAGWTSEYEKANQRVRGEREKSRRRGRRRGEDEREDLQRAQRLAFENLLPQAIDFVWKFNVRDIAGALHGACWKLLYSRTCPNRRRQARALAVLGRTFLDTAEKLKKARGGGEDEDQKTTKGYMNIKKRFDVALKMAMKDNGSKHRDD